MSTPNVEPRENSGDALIDEVRGIRREIAQQFGNDVDRLCDHLRQVEEEYRARTGVFAGVSKEAADKVVESWGEEAQRLDDPIIDEVRSLRRQAKAT